MYLSKIIVWDHTSIPTAHSIVPPDTCVTTNQLLPPLSHSRYARSNANNGLRGFITSNHCARRH